MQALSRTRNPARPQTAVRFAEQVAHTLRTSLPSKCRCTRPMSRVQERAKRVFGSAPHPLCGKGARCGFKLHDILPPTRWKVAERSAELGSRQKRDARLMKAVQTPTALGRTWSRCFDGNGRRSRMIPHEHTIAFRRGFCLVNGEALVALTMHFVSACMYEDLET